MFFSNHFSGLDRNQDTFPQPYFWFWTSTNSLCRHPNCYPTTLFQFYFSLVLLFGENIIHIHTYLFFISYFTVTHKLLFILRQGAVKYEPIIYKHTEQNQEHTICYAACQELGLSLRIPYSKQNNSTTPRDLSFSRKNSSSSIVTTSILTHFWRGLTWTTYCLSTVF